MAGDAEKSDRAADESIDDVRNMTAFSLLPATQPARELAVVLVVRADCSARRRATTRRMSIICASAWVYRGRCAMTLPRKTYSLAERFKAFC